MRFRDVIGQKDLHHQFVQMAHKGRVPHAQLFLGPKGVGKLPMALALAQFMLCEQPQEEDSCGTCSSCRKVGKLIHPDLHLSFPTITSRGSKPTSNLFIDTFRETFLADPYLDLNDWLNAIGAENKQGNITKEECVDIIRKLSLKTFEGKYKILILWQAELLGKEGNALLKLIEEPPENTLFILIAEDQEAILNTIQSRCQITRVHRLKDEEVTAALQEQFELPEDNLLTIAHLANGDLHEAIQIASKGQNDHANRFLSWFRHCYKGHGPDLVEWVGEFAGIGRERQKQFIRYGLHFLRELLQVKLNEDNRPRLGELEYKTARNMGKVLEFEQISALSELFNDLHYFVERNANPKILFLDASIRVHHIFRAPSRRKAG
ncbi:MAG: hypothetical protein AAF598_08590 [Bacteroidota bacterium]